MHTPAAEAAGHLDAGQSGAGRIALGARLLAAARLVAPGRSVADIGCDHGKLAVWLAQAGAPRVTAVDSRPQPLQRTEALVRRYGCGNIVRCVLGSGLAPLNPADAQEIVIAGLSAETIIEILNAAPWVKDENVHLVLVPASRHPRLRRWLCARGFELKAETPVLENRRSYAAMSAVYSGRQSAQSELFYQLGLVPQSQNEAAEAYIKARLRALKGEAKAPLSPQKRAQLEQLTKEVEQCLPCRK